MKCSGCERPLGLGLAIPIGAWWWCPQCGALTTFATDGTRTGHIPNRSRTVMQERPIVGLLGVAADALHAANKSIAKIDRASLLRESPVFTALESIAEALGAVIAELQAQGAEDEDALLAKGIKSRVDVVAAERERCARIVESFAKTDAASSWAFREACAAHIRSGAS